jgi:uncharacterized protein YndB with AHSA1/START domain
MKTVGKLQITTPGDREIAMTRVFDAPRQLVYRALTEPELLRRWFYGPDGWSLAVCDIDLRVGGRYRYVWRHTDRGEEMGMGGVFREVVPNQRIVATELFDEPWYPGEAVTSQVLTEALGKTTLTTTVLYASREARDGVLKSPMESGVAAGYNRLETVLTTMANANA